MKTHPSAQTRRFFKVKKASLLLFSIAVLLTGGAAAVRGQSAPDGFDPNANGLVRVVVAQPDGKILIGGDFTTLSPNGGPAVIHGRIARLNPDGTLDTAFNAGADSSVCAITLQADGKILVGGDFTSIGGQPRNRMARLNATNGLADSFNPQADERVQTIAVQPDGKILAAGRFTTIGGESRNRIARLDPTTGQADSFDPNANNIFVYSIAVQPDGKILACGDFTTLSPNGEPAVARNYLARLNTNGTLDTAFDPTPNNLVYSIAVQPDGKILVGGNFNGINSIGGQWRNHMARLEPTNGLADAFNPNAAALVLAIALQPDGRILAGGGFNGGNSIGGQSRNRIARLDATTGLADAFNPDANAIVYSIALQADGKILAGGDFTTIGDQTRNRIARFDTSQPLLNIQRSAETSVVLSWPTNFTGFTLEANTNLNTNFWSIVSPAPSVSGTNNVVTNTASGPASFYRLRQ